MIFLSGCRQQGYEQGLTYETPTAPNNLMGNASAAHSAFMFSVHDGETVTGKVAFQGVQHILGELSNTPAARVTGWTLDDITLPIYGIEMGTSCGRGIRAAWSNGFWVTQTGDVYRFDFDFEDFIQRQTWELPSSNRYFAWFPNAIFLTRDENAWRDTLLTPAASLSPPESIEMTFVSNTNEDITFTLTNNNNIQWVSGMQYRIDVLLDGIWYPIPPAENWMVIGIGLVLEAGETRTETYNWGMYGELPSGTYRLVKFDMYVIFEID